MEKDDLGFVVVLHSMSQSSVITSPLLYAVAPELLCCLPPKSSAIYCSHLLENFLVFKATSLQDYITIPLIDCQAFSSNGSPNLQP